MAQAVTHYKDPKILSDLSTDLGSAMFGMPVSQGGYKSATNLENQNAANEKQQIWDSTLGKEHSSVVKS